MQALPSAPASRPLGVIGLALSGLLLMGFHQVVSGALQHAESQRAARVQWAQAEAPCLSLADAPQRQLCLLRLQSSQPEWLAAATAP
jgi:hypothetical protein